MIVRPGSPASYRSIKRSRSFAGRTSAGRGPPNRPARARSRPRWYSTGRTSLRRPGDGPDLVPLRPATSARLMLPTSSTRSMTCPFSSPRTTTELSPAGRGWRPGRRRWTGRGRRADVLAMLVGLVDEQVGERPRKRPSRTGDRFEGTSADPERYQVLDAMMGRGGKHSRRNTAGCDDSSQAINRGPAYIC